MSHQPPANGSLHAELAQELRSRYPQCTSALVVGSYAFGRPFIDDIDLTVFDESISSGQEVMDTFHAAGFQIDVALRNPAWMEPVRAELDDVLYLLREMRKVICGIVLFDDSGLLQRTIPWWRNFEIPLRLIMPFYDR